MSNKTYFNWSTGKDSALALYHLLKDERFTVEKLVTSVNSHYNRVTMHGLPVSLLIKQAELLEIPLQTINLPEQPSMEDYETIMTQAISRLKAEGFTHSVFGDIFLEDLKAYRETNLSKVGISTVFPLWKRDTKALITEFLDLGFKAIVVCASAKHLSEDFVGKTLTKELIENLPEDVDVCGENGEFHTFCYDGPIFTTPVPFSIGEKIYREYDTPNTENEKTGFWFCDLY
ncbi:diphthine--ammonia ligase [Lacinutrix sp. Bg11-31]|uniref:Dph6-related ATP pyrophosphatase n=1 Tax=Lacinutrix sp. Bg11-31 TaxID=2057808 RepID=UPI000C3066F7|nr:diphthine--ammonia ligase [Lacinutrix sp. Bg11-31]AUC81030.1 ATP-binding protein [Lacinutrix sp. Bg11-31]